MKLIKFEVDGQINQVLNINAFDSKPEGYIEVDESIDDLVLIDLRYVKDGVLKIRNPMPSFNHVWDNEAEVWQLDLTRLRNAKATEIDEACALTIISGYESDALGRIHLYPSKITDQGNMIASVADSLNPENPENWTTPFWCQDELGQWAFKEHTVIQIRRAGAAGKAAIAACQLKNAQLQAQIANALTAEDISAVVW